MVKTLLPLGAVPFILGACAQSSKNQALEDAKSAAIWPTLFVVMLVTVCLIILISTIRVARRQDEHVTKIRNETILLSKKLSERLTEVADLARTIEQMKSWYSSDIEPLASRRRAVENLVIRALDTEHPL